MKQYFSIFCLLIGTFTLSGQTYSKIQIYLDGKPAHTLSHLGIETDHGHHAPGKHLRNIYSQEEIKAIEDAGFRYKVIIDDVKTYYDTYGTMDESELSVQQRSGNCNSTQDLYDYDTPQNYTYGSLGGYLSYFEALDELDRMRQLYPQLITERTPIGDIVTHGGKQIYYLVISNNSEVIDGDKPQVFYNSLLHAREANSLSQNIFYMWYLLENYGVDEEVTYLVDNTTMFFVPIINPDGYLFNEAIAPNGGGLWRKNRYPNAAGDTVGVDLNRNFGYEWAFDNQGSSANENSQTYRGPGPFSEPETQAIKLLCEQYDFGIALNYHTFGNLLIHPWGFSDMPTDEDELFKSLGRVMNTENDYLIGTGTETVGYTVNGDSDDYMYGDEDIYSLTPEVGEGFWPSSDNIDFFNKSTVRMNLNTAHLLLNFGWMTELYGDDLITSQEGSLFFELHKSGLQEGDITYEVQSTTPGVQLTNNVFADLGLVNSQRMEVMVDYSIDDTVESGEIAFDLIVDNGEYRHRIPLVKSYINSGDLVTPDLTLIDAVESEENYTFSGDWGLTNQDFFSPSSSITDSPSGNYQNNTSSEIRLNAPIDLTLADEAYFTFYTKYDIESNYDFVMLMISTDGNNYQPICGQQSQPAVADQSFVNLGGYTTVVGDPLYDGSQQDWVKETICLNDYVGETTVYLKWEFFSDGYVDSDGYYIDDIVIELYGDNLTSHTQELSLNGLANLRPNPATDYIQLTMPSRLYQSGYTYQISDRLGRIVLRDDLLSPSQKIQLGGLESGIYDLIIIHEQATLYQSTFIKQ